MYVEMCACVLLCLALNLSLTHKYFLVVLRSELFQQLILTNCLVVAKLLTFAYHWGQKPFALFEI